MWMHTVERKRQHRRLFFRRADQPHAGHAVQAVSGVIEQIGFAGGYALQADGGQVINRRTQRDGLPDRRRAGLEFRRNRRISRFFETHRQDHVAAALERLHLLEQSRLAVEHADAGGTAQFMP